MGVAARHDGETLIVGPTPSIALSMYPAVVGRVTTPEDVHVKGFLEWVAIRNSGSSDNGCSKR